MAKILVVDDSSLSRRISHRILEEAGHEVVDAADGLSALESYALNPPALLLLDVPMADRNGLEALGQPRAIAPAARVVMATADVQSSTRALAEAGGAVGFVTKPFVTESVLRAVTAALALQGAAP